MIIKEIRICGVLEGAGGGGEERKERKKKTYRNLYTDPFEYLTKYYCIYTYDKSPRGQARTKKN